MITPTSFPPTHAFIRSTKIVNNLNNAKSKVPTRAFCICPRKGTSAGCGRLAVRCTYCTPSTAPSLRSTGSADVPRWDHGSLNGGNTNVCSEGFENSSFLSNTANVTHLCVCVYNTKAQSHFYPLPLPISPSPSPFKTRGRGKG